MRRTPLLTRLVALITACGVLVAGLLAVTWLALGKPTPAKGEIWFQVTDVGGDAQYIAAPEQPFFFLALGNDDRTEENQGLGDAIHVIGVNPALGQATILNVPRDTTAPGGGKINGFHSLQGLPGITAQLNQMMGIQIQYAVTTSFPGFIAMVDAIGGIDVNVPTAMNDGDSGASFQPGPQRVNGTQALAFSRDRKDFLNGDITRTANQGLLILSALATLRAQNPGDAGTIRLAAILAKHVRAENVSLVDMFRLGRLGLSIDPAAVKSITIPVGSGSGTNLALASGASALFADFADDAVVQTAG